MIPITAKPGPENDQFFEMGKIAMSGLWFMSVVTASNSSFSS
jgi:hypothetical protein